jgi:hypothetical protein
MNLAMWTNVVVIVCRVLDKLRSIHTSASADVSCVFSRCDALVPCQGPAHQSYARFGRPFGSSSLCARTSSCACVRVVMRLWCR